MRTIKRRLEKVEQLNEQENRKASCDDGCLMFLETEKGCEVYKYIDQYTLLFKGIYKSLKDVEKEGPTIFYPLADTKNYKVIRGEKADK